MILFIYFFTEIEGKRGRKRGRETLMCERYIVASCTNPTGDLAHWESNWRPFRPQCTEPHQPGPGAYKFDCIKIHFRGANFPIEEAAPTLTLLSLISKVLSVTHYYIQILLSGEISLQGEKFQ